MIEVIVNCNLCPATETVVGRVESKIGLPNGWTKSHLSSDYHPYFKRAGVDLPGELHFCCSEHKQAYDEACYAARQEAEDVAAEEFQKRFALKKKAAISVVDALAEVGKKG